MAIAIDSRLAIAISLVTASIICGWNWGVCYMDQYVWLMVLALNNCVNIYHCKDCSGSVVECLTRDWGVAGSKPHWMNCVASLSNAIYLLLSTGSTRKTFPDLFVWFDSLRPINNYSVIKRLVFLGWISNKLGLMFLLKDTTQWCRWGSDLSWHYWKTVDWF